MIIYPGAALLIGFISGSLSFLGYVYGIPFLKKKIELYDTCGVLYLHGLPGVFAASTSAVVAGAIKDEKYGHSLIEELFIIVANKPYNSQIQVANQFHAIIVTVLLSGLLGYVTGKLMVLFFDSPKLYYQDEEYWLDINYDDTKNTNSFDIIESSFEQSQEHHNTAQQVPQIQLVNVEKKQL